MTKTVESRNTVRPVCSILRAVSGGQYLFNKSYGAESTGSQMLTKPSRRRRRVAHSTRQRQCIAEAKRLIFHGELRETNISRWLARRKRLTRNSTGERPPPRAKTLETSFFFVQVPLDVALYLPLKNNEAKHAPPCLVLVATISLRRLGPREGPIAPRKQPMASTPD